MVPRDEQGKPIRRTPTRTAAVAVAVGHAVWLTAAAVWVVLFLRDIFRANGKIIGSASPFSPLTKYVGLGAVIFMILMIPISIKVSGQKMKAGDWLLWILMLVTSC